MLWAVLAIFSHFLWAWVNIGDKFVVSRRVDSGAAYVLWTSLLGAGISIMLLPFVTLSVPEPRVFLTIAAGGFFYFIAAFPYIRAMQLEEPTRINVWWGLIPIFGLLFGSVFFQDRLSTRELIAFVLLVLGAVIGTIHAQRRHFGFSGKAVAFMVLSTCAYALYGVIIRSAERSLSFIEIFFWFNLVVSACALAALLLPHLRTRFMTQGRTFTPGLFGIIVAIALTHALAAFFNVWALSLKPAALVFAMEGFQVLFVFAIAAVLTKFFPAVVEEELDRWNVLIKIGAMCCVIAGLLVLSFAS